MIRRVEYIRHFGSVKNPIASITLARNFGCSNERLWFDMLIIRPQEFVYEKQARMMPFQVNVSLSSYSREAPVIDLLISRLTAIADAPAIARYSLSILKSFVYP